MAEVSLVSIRSPHQHTKVETATNDDNKEKRPCKKQRVVLIIKSRETTKAQRAIKTEFGTQKKAQRQCKSRMLRPVGTSRETVITVHHG